MPQLCRCLRPGTLPLVHCQSRVDRGQASLVRTALCLFSVVTGDHTSLERSSSSHLETPTPFVSSSLPLCPDASPLEVTAGGREAGSLPELHLWVQLEATASGSQDSFILALRKEGGKQLKAAGRCLDPCLGYLKSSEGQAREGEGEEGGFGSGHRSACLLGSMTWCYEHGRAATVKTRLFSTQ